MNKILTVLLISLTLLVKAQTTLPTSWNFSAPGISAPPVGWFPSLGTNGNLTYASGTGDAVSCRLDATGENLIIMFTDKPGPISYYLKGTGISPNPAFGGTFTIQEGTDTNNWTEMRSVTSMTGSFVRYMDNPQPTTRCIRFFYTSKLSGSNVALDSVWIQAAPASPSATINVKQGTQTIVNANTFVIGQSISTLFTIQNTGTSEALTLSNSFSGVNASDYSIGYFPSSVAANSSDTFSVTFNPTSSGSRLATLTITNNDVTKNPFEIKLYGISGSYASQPIAQPTNLTFLNTNAFSFNVRFNNANTLPEKYIVLRKKDAVITEIPVDGHTYTRGDYIGGAQVAYIGTDTFFKPTGIIANSSYYFQVFACNGPAGYEKYLTASPLSAVNTTSGSNIGNYYNGINPSSPTFVTDVHNKINPHDTLFYSYYASYLINNFYTRDTTGGKKVVSCVYTNLPYIYNEPFLWWNGSNSGTLTREHTFSQSWMPSNVGNSKWPNDAATGTHELPEYCDLHHLFPADQANANGKRSNFAFGEVVGTPTFISSTGMGKLGNDSNGNKVWEPRDSHKGDLARAMFYMCETYNGVNGNNWSLPAIINQSILKKWHFQDPPDAWEIARHEYIASVQHNRNPFIDSIYWVNKINFANMTLISSAIPGITLTSPNGAENWKSNSTYAINWASSNVDFVKIDLLLNDTLFAVLSNSTLASAGTFSWTISPISLSSTKAKIRLTDTKSIANSVSANYFTITSSTGVNEINYAKNISVYPNPSQGNISINFDMQLKGLAQITVFDIAGRFIKSIETNDNVTSVSIENKGVYIVQLKVNETIVYKKVVIE